MPAILSLNAKKILKHMEKQMFEHASNMEFEQAAELRDRIRALEQQFLQV